MGPAKMNDLTAAFAAALRLITSLDPDLLEIIGLSLRVSLTALVAACVLGFPLGAATALLRFPGRRFLIILLNALMGLPPVVVGLLVYLMLSRSGPFGTLGLLYTPGAMIVAQTLLIAPIIAALTRQVVQDLWAEYEDQLTSLGASRARAIPTLLRDGRVALVTVALAGFGRAIAEVGAVMIVGGNIDHATRVMTTAIALELSKGDLPLALGLGIVLLALTLVVNSLAQLLRDRSSDPAESPA